MMSLIECSSMSEIDEICVSLLHSHQEDHQFPMIKISFVCFKEKILQPFGAGYVVPKQYNFQNVYITWYNLLNIISITL